MKGLLIEWTRWLPILSQAKVVSIYFGGGTPALLGAISIGEILSWIYKGAFVSEKAEITLETNPENVTLENMKSYAEIGINRISIGVQTLDDQILKLLNRIHHPLKAIEAITTTAEAGIHNISIDLMYDLPGQTLTIWENTLQQIKTLPISHLSLYNLTIEPHTLFFKTQGKIRQMLPNEKESLQMYEMAVNKLEKMGLHQYEISAFAKSHQKSFHNSGYWTGRPFLGFGPSAFSYLNGKRFRNIANLNRYTDALEKGDSPVDFEEKLSHEAHLRELLAINLRLIEGVDLCCFQEQHGQLDTRTMTVISQLQSLNFLEFRNSRLKLSKRGILFYDTVATEII